MSPSPSFRQDFSEVVIFRMDLEGFARTSEVDIDEGEEGEAEPGTQSSMSTATQEAAVLCVGLNLWPTQTLSYTRSSDIQVPKQP